MTQLANRIAHAIARRRPAIGGAGIDTLAEGRAVASHYLYFRRLPFYGAERALEAARALPAAYVAGREYYGPSEPWGAAYVSAGDTLRHVSDTKAAGLRFVGWADELAGLRHTGWHCDGEGRDTLRGAVWQLPGKGRTARMIYGYCEMESARGGSVEMNEGSAIVCVSDVRLADMAGEFGNLDETEGARDAARSADSLAEHDAEERRDYNESYEAGTAAAEADNAAAEARRELLPLLAEMRTLRRSSVAGNVPSVCAALRRQIDSLLETISDKRAERDSAWAAVSYPPALEAWRAGFMDSASFVRAVALRYASRADWRGAPEANPCGGPCVTGA